MVCAALSGRRSRRGAPRDAVTSGKRLDARCRPESAALRVAPRRPPAASRPSTVVAAALFGPLLADRPPGRDAGRDPGEKCGLSSVLQIEGYPISNPRSPLSGARHRPTRRKMPSGRDDEEALTAAIIRLASQYGRYGYRRITALLRAEGRHYNTIRPHSSLRYGPPAPETVLPNIEGPTYGVDGLRSALQLKPRQALT